MSRRITCLTPLVGFKDGFVFNYTVTVKGRPCSPLMGMFILHGVTRWSF